MDVKVREWFSRAREGGPLLCRRDGFYTVGFIHSVNV